MRYFIDTEYIYNGDALPELLSIGIVREDGEDFYTVNYDCDLSKASDWVKENVIPNLPIRGNGMFFKPTAPKRLIKDYILQFIGHDKPEFWGDCCAFDFVILSQLMGTFNDWPEGWPYYFNDIQQLACESPAQIPEQETVLHNALADAKHIKFVWEHLMEAM